MNAARHPGIFRVPTHPQRGYHPKRLPPSLALSTSWREISISADEMYWLLRDYPTLEDLIWLELNVTDLESLAVVRYCITTLKEGLNR